MMTPRTLRTLLTVATVGLLVAVPSVHSAFGWFPTCGGTVPAGTFTPGAPVALICDNTTVPPGGCVLTLSIPSHLNMNGLTIQCTGSGQTGICITAAQSSVKGPGTVFNCATGVSTSSSNDRVMGVAVVNNGIGLFELSSASATNSFKGNWAIGNTVAGIEAQGAFIKIDKNVVAGNGIGIELRGTLNVAHGNTVVGNTYDGILGNGAMQAGIASNLVTANN